MLILTISGNYDIEREIQEKQTFVRAPLTYCMPNIYLFLIFNLSSLTDYGEAKTGVKWFFTFDINSHTLCVLYCEKAIGV